MAGWTDAVSAIGGTVVPAIGSLLGLSSNNSANKTNLQIAQMNNEYNERMLDKQMSYNTKMWNAQNEYNTPANQRARLEAAGINPQLAMSNISTGSAESANGVTTPTASEAGKQQAFDPSSGFNAAGASLSQFSNTVANSELARANKANVEANTKQVQIDNQTRLAENVAKICQMLASAKSDTEKAVLTQLLQDAQRTTNDIQKATKQDVIDETHWRSLRANIEYQQQREILKWLPRQQQAEVAYKNAQTKLAYEQKKLTRQQALTEIAKRTFMKKQGNLLDKQAETEFWKGINEFLDANTDDWYEDSDFSKTSHVGPVNVTDSHKVYSRGRHRPSIDSPQFLK